MDKVKRNINYIIHKFIEQPTKLSKVKLAKILYFADREYMYKYSKYLSGAEYIKLPHGPVIKNYDKILESMQNEGIISQFKTTLHEKSATCFQSLIEPNLDDFSVDEVVILDKVIYENYNKSAKTLSNLTHDSVWDNTKMGDVIPVEMVFLRDSEEPTNSDIEKAKEFLKEKGYIHENI